MFNFYLVSLFRGQVHLDIHCKKYFFDQGCQVLLFPVILIFFNQIRMYHLFLSDHPVE